MRRLLTGLNGVAVSYAYVARATSTRYDTALEAQSELRTIEHASVRREAAGSGLNRVVTDLAESGDAPHLLTVRHWGYALLSTTIDEVRQRWKPA